MFNTKFETIESCMKLNNLNEKELVHHLKQYFANQNYRADYNKRKNEAFKAVKNNPEIAAQIAQLMKKA